MTIETRNHEAVIANCVELAALVERHTAGQGNAAYTTAINSLEFTREGELGTVIRGVSEPLLAIVVQGKKEVLLNEETYRYGVARCRSVSSCVSGFTGEWMCGRSNP